MEPARFQTLSSSIFRRAFQPRRVVSYNLSSVACRIQTGQGFVPKEDHLSPALLRYAPILRDSLQNLASGLSPPASLYCSDWKHFRDGGCRAWLLDPSVLRRALRFGRP